MEQFGKWKGTGRARNWFLNQGFNNYNRVSSYFGGAQSTTSQLDNALGVMASIAEACRFGQNMTQSSVLPPGAFGNDQVPPPGQNANVPGAASNPQDGQLLVTSLQDVLDTALQRIYPVGIRVLSSSILLASLSWLDQSLQQGGSAVKLGTTLRPLSLLLHRPLLPRRLIHSGLHLVMALETGCWEKLL